MARDAQIQMRRDTAANWTSVNPTLANGEFGYETNTSLFKIGDGTTAWNSLTYAASKPTELSNSQPSTFIDFPDRMSCSSAALSVTVTTGTAGTVRHVFFTPIRTMTITQIATCTGSSGANYGTATGLNVRMGLFTVDSSDNITLVARTDSDSTLFTAASTLYTRSFGTTGGYPSSYTLVAGTRYAAGMCVYASGGTITTLPNFVGTAGSSGITTTVPRTSSVVTTGANSQDLLTLTVGSLSATGNHQYFRFS